MKLNLVKVKTCPNRHIKDCKNWQKSTCKFETSCEFKHDENKKNKKQLAYYDNFDDVDIEQNFVETVEYSCDICDYQTENEVNLKMHKKSYHNKDSLNFTIINNDPVDEFYDYDNNFDSDDDEVEDIIEEKQNHYKTVEYSCDKCDYKTKSKIHFKIHEKSCRERMEQNKE